MLSALALTVALSSLSSDETPIRLSLDAVPSAHLVAQAPPPLPVREAPMPGAGGARELQLQADIDAINNELRGLKTDWPTASVVMAYLGWSLSPVALVGLLVLAVGLALPVVNPITLVGVVLLVIGLGGVALGIAGIATGIAASSAAKEQRDELIQRRQGLERELKQLRQGGGPAGVDRSFESSPRLITVASF